MRETVLVTGGAGFIGSHLVDAQIKRGHRVRIFDNLAPQVHGSGSSVPAYLHPAAEFVYGDVRDCDALRCALDGVTVIFHQAAAVGVGQSMYQIHRYIDVNILGTAVLLDLLANERHSVCKLIVASSMSVYGEGQYICDACGPILPRLRPDSQLVGHDWEIHCPCCDNLLSPVSTTEDKPLHPTSVYAISKRDQEEMCLCVGRAYGIPTVALRYFNVYGPRQALSNPYTGVIAIFSSRLLNGQPPVIYEDGQQRRDYIHVHDIVQANLLALDNDAANYEVFNVGTGQPVTVLDIARVLCHELGNGITPIITNQFRGGDIRHCYADIGKIRSLLDFEPTVRFEDGVINLIAWVRQQKAADRFEQAWAELEVKQLVY